jgi:multidrug resistance efflux pump
MNSQYSHTMVRLLRRPDHLQRFVRARVVRLTLAGLFMLAGLWAFYPYFIYRVAGSAFVNAEIMRVAAPIAGRLTRDLPGKGDFIAHQSNISLIDSLSPDRRHLLDLEAQYAVAQKRAELDRTQLDEVMGNDRALADRTEAYLNGMVQRLTQELKESTAERAGCLAELGTRKDIGSRMDKLVQSGVASVIRSAEVHASQESAATHCEMADARAERLRVELDAASHGVFLRDGANDVPYSQQQRDRLLLRKQELQTQLLEDGLRATELGNEITEERARIDRLSHFDLMLPGDHVVWEVAASPGSTVTEGQTLLDLVSCNRRFVAVELPERDFEQIRAGDTTAVRLIGSDEWHQGVVRQVRGSAARTDDRLLAAQVPTPTSGSITVEVELPPEEAPVQKNSFCGVGRLAEVRFTRRLGYFNELAHALSRFISGRSEIATQIPASR